MHRLFVTTALPLALIATAAVAQPAAAPTPKLAPLSQLVSEVNIPYQTFTLPNGLTTIVNTDRKAPIVGVTVYYRVGSKNEPRGHTGFAHLFEHLMFGGSLNVPNFDVPLEGAGSDSTNGSTWYDRTNYVETVPEGALDLALFEESDRMGYLLGAVNQDKLDKQRGVVENEKRQDDNQPYGLVQYHTNDALLPIGHPYRHTTIGSMRDLDAATLTTVRNWFIDHYGPNNVVLALSGDIDLATAKQKVTQWFGAIPRGPAVNPVAAPPVQLTAPKRETITDQVPVTRILRTWIGPGVNAPDDVALEAGMNVLGGLASSRLDNALVRGSEMAVSVSADIEQHEQLGFVEAQMDVKPGVDPAAAEKKFDEVIADLVKNGPTRDELQRAATSIVSSEIGKLEVVGGFSGKGATLAEGKLYSNDPAHYKKELAELAALTPAKVQAALQKWVGKPAYTLTIKPGQRTESGDLLGGWGDEGKVPPARIVEKPPVLPQMVKRAVPPVAPVQDLTFPAIEHARLANGIPVELARRTAIPKVSLALTFDAGNAADPTAEAGKQSLMMDALEEGTTTRTAEQIAEQQERLGANIGTGTISDVSQVTMTALTANLLPSLELMADVTLHPAFHDADVARVRAQRLAEIAQEQSDPTGLAERAIRPLIYGTTHPYGSVGGSGKAAYVQTLTPADLSAEHAKWLRPDLARITVVGNVTMAELLPKLNAAFGDWKAPASPAPAKPIDTAAVAPAKPQLVVIDRPNSPQSVLLLGKVLPVKGTDKGQEAVELANQVVGNDFLSRLNSDLREEKGWTYGIESALFQVEGPRGFIVVSPVQTDRTADSISLILKDMKAFPAQKPVDPVELQRVTQGNIRNLPDQFQTNGQVLGALLENQRLDRPDDYQAKLPDIYRSITAADIDKAASQYLQPDGMVIVVVGDRSKIDPQLKTLGMPIEYEEAKDL
ncbi:MAG TPA: pitrilysin family protein [Croceibacterium sp.]|jgi:predicted Zn-dependent peptidase